MILIESAKKTANQFKDELGFVNRAALEESLKRSELEVIEGVGFVHFHNRKDRQSTIYEIAVDKSHQKQGWGRLLFYRVLATAIERNKTKIVAKCPVDLPSNGFYKSLGFNLVEVEKGRKRKLNRWQYDIASPLLFYCADGGRNRYSKIAKEENWLLGLRSDQTIVKNHCPMIDNHWKHYCHKKHLEVVTNHKPFLATALDIETPEQYSLVLEQARELSCYTARILIIPKCEIDLSQIDFPFWLGFSVPTKYGGTNLPISFFEGYPIHLLGGSPTQQANYAKWMNVVSLDSNYAMNLARFGKTSFIGCDSGKKMICGNYDSFRLSLKKQRQYWWKEWHWQDEPLSLLVNWED